MDHEYKTKCKVSHKNNMTNVAEMSPKCPTSVYLYLGFFLMISEILHDGFKQQYKIKFPVLYKDKTGQFFRIHV